MPAVQGCLGMINPRKERLVLDQEKHFREVLERSVQKHLGFLLKKPILCSPPLRCTPRLPDIPSFSSVAHSPHSDGSSSESDVEQRSSNPMEQVRIPSYHTDQGRQPSPQPANHSPVQVHQIECIETPHRLQQTSCLTSWIGGSKSDRKSYGLVVHLAKILTARGRIVEKNLVSTSCLV